VPTGEVPGGGSLPSVPTVPSLPVPTISVGVSVPGTSTGAGSSTGGSTPSSPLELEVCLGPIQVNCPD
jgi:hypothetical protein